MHCDHTEGTMRFALATIVTDNFDDMGDFYAKVLQKKIRVYRRLRRIYTLDDLLCSGEVAHRCLGQ